MAHHRPDRCGEPMGSTLAASAVANRIHKRRLARVAGVTFTVLGAMMLASRYILQSSSRSTG